MKCTITKEVLEYGISVAERFTGKNLNLPILANVLLETDSGVLEITATNLEYAVKVTIPTKTQVRGKVSVPAKILAQYIQSIREPQIDLEEKGGNLLLSTDSREGKINGVPTDNFPLIPKIKKLQNYEIDSLALSNALEHVLPSVSTSEFKPELNGVYVRIGKNEVTLAATDTFRLAEKKMKLSSSKGEEGKSFILPWRVAQELARIFGSEEKKIEVALGENQIEISSEGIHIFSRLIDGNFPEYSAIIPKNFSSSVFLERGPIVESIRSSSIFASKLQDVNLILSQKKVDITSENSEIGKNSVSLAASLTGKPVSLSFNYRFLLDGLNGLSEEEFFFGCNEPTQPALIRNKADASFLYVIMPIRLT